jgi:hypothetical protein
MDRSVMVVLAVVIPNPAGVAAVASLLEVLVAAFGSKAVVGVGVGVGLGMAASVLEVVVPSHED